MPMHRTLPDFVEMNEKRYHFYEDPKNVATVVDGLKFIQKVNPTYFQAIPSAVELIGNVDLKFRPKESRVNIFELDKPIKPATAQTTTSSIPAKSAVS
jgi:hypothetical protein